MPLEATSSSLLIDTSPLGEGRLVLPLRRGALGWVAPALSQRETLCSLPSMVTIPLNLGLLGLSELTSHNAIRIPFSVIVVSPATVPEGDDITADGNVLRVQQRS